MKSKKLIAFFLFLTLGIQILPLKQIAAWLSSGQVTEEIAHSINPVKAKSALDDVHPPFSTGGQIHNVRSLSNWSLLNHTYAEALYLRHADDIISPPPNS